MSLLWLELHFFDWEKADKSEIIKGVNSDMVMKVVFLDQESAVNGMVDIRRIYVNLSMNFFV